MLKEVSPPDLFSEGLVPLAAAAKLLPKRRGGKPTHVATLFRWVQRGVKGVRLEAVQCGGVKCTSRPALSRFFQRLTSGGDPLPVKTTKQRKRNIERAERELAKAGI